MSCEYERIVSAGGFAPRVGLTIISFSLVAYVGTWNLNVLQGFFPHFFYGSMSNRVSPLR